jgi:hypothetical protein
MNGLNNLKRNSMTKLLILLALAVTSCVTSNQEKDIRIYYINGEVEDVTLSTEKGYRNQIGDKEATIYFNNGCLYKDYNLSKYDAKFTDCIRCGVKSYNVLEVRIIKKK